MNVRNTCERMRNSPAIAGFLQCNDGKTSNVFSSFFVCSNRNRSAVVHELLSNNSLFVVQLYEDKSPALQSRV